MTDNSIELTFDGTVYTTSCVKSAAYRGMREFTAEIKKESEQIFCRLSKLPDCDQDSFEAAITEFQKNVLDYSLREELEKKTSDIRNLILNLAFSKTGLTDE